MLRVGASAARSPVLHLAQVVLLARYRALPEDAPPEQRETLLDAIHHSVNRIAAGLQTTG